jgi:hypothetical protein
LTRCGDKTTKIFFTKRLLKDSTENVCAAFGIKTTTECEEEFAKIDSIQYNILHVRDITGGNELVLTTMMIL